MSGPRTMFDKIRDAHIVAEVPGGQTLLFIDRHLLHEGDEIALTLTHESAIAAFEGRRRAEAPWLFG